MELVVRLVGLVETVGFGNVAIEFFPYSHSGLVGPETSNVVNCVASPSQHHERDSERHHLLNTGPMSADG